MDISWVRGSGDGVIVLVRQGNDPDVSTLGAGKSTVGWSASAGYTGSNTIATNSGDLVYKGTGTSVSVTGLIASTTYHVMVLEYNDNGVNTVDIQNSTAAFNPRYKQTLAMSLSAPSSISTSAITATTATIIWTDASNAVGYYLDVQLDKDFITGYDLLDIGDNAPNNYLITGLPTPSTTGSPGRYRYRLRSYDAQGKVSNASAWIDFNTMDFDPTVTTGGPTSLCGLLSFTLSGTISTTSGYTPSPATGTWTTVSNPVGATASFSPDAYTGAATVTVSAYGTYVFEYTIRVGEYYDSDTYTVNFLDVPTANAGTDANACALTYTLAATSLVQGQTGTWTFVSGAGTPTFGNTSSPTSTANVNNYGAYTFRWNITSASCTASDDVIITYTQQPTTANAGTDGSNCGLTGYTLSGNTASVGTGTWTQISGSGTASFTSPNSGTSNVSVNVQGTYTFQWKIMNGACSSADQVDVIFYASPTTATVTTATENVCGYTLALDGNTPTVGTGTWSQVSGPSTASFSPNANTPGATVTVDRQGSWSFAWTIGNGTCTPSAAGKVIYFYGTPTTANAGNDGSACGLSYTLQGNTPTVGTGLWSQVSGVGTASFANTTTPGALATIPSFTGNSTDYTFKWTISNGTCTASEDQVTITYYNSPTTATVTTAAETVCGLTWTMDGNTPTVGTGSWTSQPPVSGAAPNGTGTVSFGSTTNPTTTVSVTSGGLYHFTWTISNGTCSASTKSKTITFYETPTTASAGDDGSACGRTYTLAGNAPTVGTGSWTKVSGVGTVSFANTTTPGAVVTIPTFTGASTSYTFNWSISNGTCTGNSDDVNVTFYNSPTTATVNEISSTVCGLTYTLDGNTPTVGTGSWSVYSPTSINYNCGTASFGNVTNPTTTVTVSEACTYHFKWTISNGTCADSHIGKTVTFYETPTIASAGSNASVCSYSYNLAGNQATVGTGTWTQLTGGPGTATFADANLETSLVTVNTIGTYNFRWSIGNGTCSASYDDVQVIFSTPLTANAGIDAYGCYDAQGLTGVYTLSAASPSPGTGSWTVISVPAGGTASFGSTTSPTSTVTVNKLGDYDLLWTVTNGSCTESSDVVITFVNSLVYTNQVISGLHVVSAGTSGVEYSVPSLEGALSYTWTYTPAGDVTIQGSGTNSYTTGNIIKIDFGMNATITTGGILRLVPNGLCGPGTQLLFDITVNNNPVILSSTLDASGPNKYLNIVTNQNVYTNNDGTGDLVASDFQIIFVKGSGTATAASISSVEMGADRMHWKLNLSITGTPNGCETIEVKPLTNAVYNWISSVASAMASTETSGIKNLYNESKPTTAATSGATSNVYSSQMKFTWTVGNGSKRIVVASKTAPIVPPAQYTNYTANSQFGLGSTTSSGNFVVYNGNGNSVTVTGLDASTTYNFQVFEYNQACGTANYMTTGTTSSATTTPTATKLVITSTVPTLVISGEVWSSITIQAQDAGGTPRTPMADETITLSDNNGGTWSGNTGIISATSTSLTLSSVKYMKSAGALNTTFTADDGPEGNNLTAATFAVNVRPDDPTTHAKNIIFTISDHDSIGLYWTKGSGDGRMLIIKRVNASDKVPANALTDGTDYSDVSTTNANAIVLTSGKSISYTPYNAYVVYRTEGTDSASNAALIKGFEAATYSFRITEFAHAPAGASVWETYNFKTTSGESRNPRSHAAAGKIGSFSGIEISEFYGRSYDAKAELNWEAISEDGITGYEIYRMNPALGDEFVKVGDVNVKTAVGGSNTYKLIDGDKSLEVGKEYLYRLVGIGFDGEHYNLSEVALTILTMPDTDNSLYVSEVNPNPVKEVVRFNVQTAKSAPVVIEILNSIGQVIFTDTRTINGVQNFEYNMATKAAGKYYITVTSGQDAVLTPFVFVP